MSSIGIGDCDCEYGSKKAKLSISALTGGWGCGEDDTPRSVSISIYPEDDSGGKDTELIFLTSRQVADLISQMQIANETVRYSWEEIGSEKLKDMDVHFIPPFQWELDEMEKERQEKLESVRIHEEIVNNPQNKHCASCKHYDKGRELCTKHFVEQQEEYNRLMRDIEHLSETRARRMELSHVHRNRPEDTCGDWER